MTVDRDPVHIVTVDPIEGLVGIVPLVRCRRQGNVVDRPGWTNGDAAVRYGGEELIVIMPNTGSDEAVTIAERLRTAVYKQVIFSKDNAPLPGVTASIGVAL
jgi:hypothetical protein